MNSFHENVFNVPIYFSIADTYFKKCNWYDLHFEVEKKMRERDGKKTMIA